MEKGEVLVGILADIIAFILFFVILAVTVSLQFAELIFIICFIIGIGAIIDGLRRR
jgi:hypothetical protein